MEEERRKCLEKATEILILAEELAKRERELEIREVRFIEERAEFERRRANEAEWSKDFAKTAADAHARIEHHVKELTSKRRTIEMVFKAQAEVEATQMMKRARSEVRGRRKKARSEIEDEAGENNDVAVSTTE